jgi:hypothetical protein
MLTNRTRTRSGMRQAKGYAALTTALMQYLFAGFDLYDHLSSCWTDELDINWQQKRDMDGKRQKR